MLTTRQCNMSCPLAHHSHCFMLASEPASSSGQNSQALTSHMKGTSTPANTSAHTNPRCSQRTRRRRLLTYEYSRCKALLSIISLAAAEHSWLAKQHCQALISFGERLGSLCGHQLSIHALDDHARIHTCAWCAALLPRASTR